MSIVITHPEHGILLGTCLGMCFWSKVDPVGQPSAVTFDDEKQAKEFMATWDDGVPAHIAFHAVVPDDGVYVTIAGCVAAGLEGWIDEITPVANERMC